jgi:hypothetical protein
MRTAHAIAWPSAAEPPRRFRSQLAVRVGARLHAPSLDRELASGIAPWRWPLHAARAVALTGDRSRRGLAPSLERLVEQAARLNILLSDGSAPCYVRIRRNALTDALQEISQWLAVPQ